MATLHSVLKPSSEILVVDVGANPIDDVPPYRPLMVGRQARVVGFEPNPKALAELNRRKGPNETYLPHAVGDGGRHTLNICLSPGMTSLLQPNPAVLSLFHRFEDWGTVLRTEEVDTVRLDDVPETAGVDMLKIDIQGAELMVFQNAPQRLSSALLIHTEVEFLPLYSGQPLFSDIDQYLRQFGFVLHKFGPLASRTFKPIMLNNDIFAGMSQVIWADAVFVRDFTRLELLDDEALLRLALILHCCYQSYDLVTVLLTEHERRTGSGHAQRYLEMIVDSSLI